MTARLLTRSMAGLLLGSALLGAFTPAPAADEQAALERVRNDCRVEGEAAGLSGEALERFIRDCVADLRELELINVERR